MDYLICMNSGYSFDYCLVFEYVDWFEGIYLKLDCKFDCLYG